jgi:hypothetical protein
VLVLVLVLVLDFLARSRPRKAIEPDERTSRRFPRLPSNRPVVVLRRRFVRDQQSEDDDHTDEGTIRRFR